MPWTAKDAPSHTKKANTVAEKKQWAATANKVLQRTGNEGKAIRVANSTLKRGKR